MKSGTGNKTVYCLLFGFLFIVSNALAADKHSSKLGVRLAPAVVVPNNSLEQRALVAKKSASNPAKGASSYLQPSVPYASVPSILAPFAPVKRSVVKTRPTAHLPVTPVLPGIPTRHAPAVAPSIFNPRKQIGAGLQSPGLPGGHKSAGKQGGLGLAPPVMHRPTRSAQPLHLAVTPSTAQGREKSLSPLTRPDTGVAGAGRTTGGDSYNSRYRPPPTAGTRQHGGFAPAGSGTHSTTPAGSSYRPGHTETPDRRQSGHQEAAANTVLGPSQPQGHGGFVPMTDSQGRQMYGSGDGTRIPVTGRHGESSQINGDGSVSYSDGTRVEHNDMTGETRTTHPDGLVDVHHRGQGDTPINPDYDPEQGVSPGNDPHHLPAPRYNSGDDSFVYSDGVGVKASHNNGPQGRIQDNGDIVYSDGTRYSHDTMTGRTTVRHADGSTDIYENDTGTRGSRSSGHLHTGFGVDTAPSDDGGTDVFDRETGTSAHFGGGRVTNGGMGHAKYDAETDTLDFGDGTHIPATDSSGAPSRINADGSVDYNDGTHVEHNTATGETTITHPDGSTTTQHRGDGRPLKGTSSTQDSDDDSSASSDSSSDDHSDDSSADNSSDDSDSSDEASSSEDQSDDSSSDNSSDDSDSSDDDSSDESSVGFGGRSGDGGSSPGVKTTVEDRVSRMKGEKHDPESLDDAEPGRGNSVPDSVSQPGPSGGRRGVPLARPSADGHQTLIGKVVTPTVKTRSSAGGGDCFRPEGCGDTPTGGFQLDPFDRDPQTNPGGH